VPSETSLHPIKQASEADLGSSLQSSGMTLRRRKDSGSVAATFLLAKNSIGCQQVYQVLHSMCH
jgi:hypothetical protein